MKSLSKAAKYNEEGSTALELGETSKALKHFRAGLKQLNEGCHSAQTMRSVPVTRNSAPITAISSNPCRLGDNSVEQDISAHQPTVNFSQSFVFCAENLCDKDMTVEKQSFFSAVLIYNTALALHQKAVHEDSPQDRKKSYLKSLLFYNESMNLLRPCAEQTEAFRVIQEILRNQGDIYYRLNDLGSLQRVWEELAALTKDRNVPGISQNTAVALTA